MRRVIQGNDNLRHWQNLSPEISPSSEDSLDLVAGKLMDVLSERGTKITLLEEATLGSISVHLTRPKSTGVYTMGGIISNDTVKRMILGPAAGIIDVGDSYGPETSAALLQSVQGEWSQDIVLLTVGDSRKRIGEPSPVSIVFTLPGQEHMPFGTTIDVGTIRPSDRSRFLAYWAMTMVYGGLTGNHHGIAYGEQLPSSNIHSDAQFMQMVDGTGLLLARQNHTIASLESCTGGAVGETLASLPNEVNLHVGSWVVYNEQAKAYFGMPKEALESHPYTRYVAMQMAIIARQKFGASVGIGVTGLMETKDTRYSEVNPGTVFVGFAINGKPPFSEKLTVPIGPRGQMKHQAVYEALKHLNNALDPHSALPITPFTYE